MGGRLTVTSKVNHGSTFTFVLPHKVPHACESSDENEEYQDGDGNASMEEDDVKCGFFQFKTRTLGSLFSSNGSDPSHTLTRNEVVSDKLDRFSVLENNNTNQKSADQDRPFHDPCIQKNRPLKTNISISSARPKILLVEDHVVNVMVAKRMMRQLNQDMDVVNNGVEALLAVQRCDYSLILMVIYQ